MMKRLFLPLIAALVLLVSAGCDGETVRPVERQQIKNLVEDYVIRNTNLPEYEVSIEATTANWARVSISPVGVDPEPGPDIVYLQKQVEAPSGDGASTASTVADQEQLTTSSGWTIVLGPQATFTATELDEVGVPQDIHP